MGPWESAHRRAGYPVEDASVSLAYARHLDELGVPPIRQVGFAGNEPPRSELLRAMYAQQPRLWAVWQPRPFLKRVVTFLRTGEWADGEWVER